MSPLGAASPPFPLSRHKNQSIYKKKKKRNFDQNQAKKTLIEIYIHNYTIKFPNLSLVCAHDLQQIFVFKPLKKKKCQTLTLNKDYGYGGGFDGGFGGNGYGSGGGAGGRGAGGPRGGPKGIHNTWPLKN